MQESCMHCDDKRMMYVLKREIEQMWTELKTSDFQNQELLNKLTESIKEYEDYRKMSKG